MVTKQWRRTSMVDNLKNWKFEYLSNHSKVLPRYMKIFPKNHVCIFRRENSYENPEEISSVALLSPACFICFTQWSSVLAFGLATISVRLYYLYFPFSDFVSNSIVLDSAVCPSVSKSLKSWQLMNCGCGLTPATNLNKQAQQSIM